MSSAPNARAAAVEELSRLLNIAAAHLDSAVAAELDGLTTAQWHVLAALEGGTGRSMSELAAVTLLPGPSLTRLIDGMIDENLVHRRPDETDRRRVVVFATRRGAMLHSRSKSRIARSSAVAGVIDDADGPGARLASALGALGAMDLTG